MNFHPFGISFGQTGIFYSVRPVLHPQTEFLFSVSVLHPFRLIILQTFPGISLRFFPFILDHLFPYNKNSSRRFVFENLIKEEMLWKKNTAGLWRESTATTIFCSQAA